MRVHDPQERQEEIGRGDLGTQRKNRRSVRYPLRRREKEKAQGAIRERRDRVEGRNRRVTGHVEVSKRHDRT